MSNQPFKHSPEQCDPAAACANYPLGVFLALLISLAFIPLTVHGEGLDPRADRPLPLLVEARQDDTPATLAQRYLNESSRGWMIVEYNGRATFQGGQAVMIPKGPFRLGGLSPKGYQTVPVLVYPAVGAASDSSKRISPADFEAQMSWLKNSGFTAISPAQLVTFMTFSGQLPRHSVLITADTESCSFLELAVPILKKIGFTATLFVVTDRVGGPETMTWEQLKQLQALGFTIGCRVRNGRLPTLHTSGYPAEADFKALEAELHQAKKTIEHHLDIPYTALAYPSGRHSDLVAAMAAKLGFSSAFVRSAGENPFFGSRFGIHRMVIDSRLDPEQFAKMLTPLVTADLE